MTLANIRQAKGLGHFVNAAGVRRGSAMRDATRVAPRIPGSSMHSEFHDERK
jgi:hypothetical protein